jgi:hypothetical protein
LGGEREPPFNKTPFFTSRSAGYWHGWEKRQHFPVDSSRPLTEKRLPAEATDGRSALPLARR